MTRLKTSLFFIIAALVILPTAEGALYRWVDENGVVHFDEAQPGDVGSAVKIEPGPANGNNNQGDEGPQTNPAESDESSRGKPDGDVTSENAPPHVAELYITRWCTYCKMAADFLRSKGVPFVWYDIERDREAALRKMQMDPKPGVPFAVINGFRIHGFSVEAYEKALSFNPQNQESK
jgi:glutaredoxin